MKYDEEPQALRAIRFTLGLTKEEMDDFIAAYNRLVLGLKIIFFVIVALIVVRISSLIIGGLMK